MATEFQIGNIVKYMFGEAPKYKVMATREQPRLRENASEVKVPDGYDYYIIETPLKPKENGELTSFLPVMEAHLELISKE